MYVSMKLTLKARMHIKIDNSHCGREQNNISDVGPMVKPFYLVPSYRFK